jgi:hypothetical protein
MSVKKGDVFISLMSITLFTAMLAVSGMNYNAQQVKFIEKVG